VNIRLKTIGRGIHAAFYKGGVVIAEQDMGDEAVVQRPTSEEMRDQPAVQPDIAESRDGLLTLSFTGFYVVSGNGPRSGLAAIFGAIKPEN
jgi:hypothetical protein